MTAVGHFHAHDVMLYWDTTGERTLLDPQDPQVERLHCLVTLLPCKQPWAHPATPTLHEYHALSSLITVVSLHVSLPSLKLFHLDPDRVDAASKSELTQ